MYIINSNHNFTSSTSYCDIMFKDGNLNGCPIHKFIITILVIQMIFIWFLMLYLYFEHFRIILFCISICSHLFSRYLRPLLLSQRCFQIFKEVLKKFLSSLSPFFHVLQIFRVGKSRRKFSGLEILVLFLIKKKFSTFICFSFYQNLNLVCYVLESVNTLNL